jgi:hypothetical protein
MITDALIDQIAIVVQRAGLSGQSVAALRDAFPGIQFTHCLDDDIGAGIEPFREAEGFNIYLVDAGNHCMTFTRSLDNATGLVLAEVEPDG